MWYTNPIIELKIESSPFDEVWLPAARRTDKAVEIYLKHLIEDGYWRQTVIDAFKALPYVDHMFKVGAGCPHDAMQAYFMLYQVIIGEWLSGDLKLEVPMNKGKYRYTILNAYQNLRETVFSTEEVESLNKAIYPTEDDMQRLFAMPIKDRKDFKRSES